jgi:RNA polymerase sigma-70 factor (ECF subfamily)
MTSLARSILRGIADPADAVASALERLIEEGSVDAERFEHLTRNEANSLRTKTLRDRRRETPIGLLPDLAELEEGLLSTVTSTGGPSFALASFPEDFDAAVRALPEPERDTLILTDLRGLGQEEVAGLLDVSQPTVSRRLDAARAVLRKELT